ncbi:MAG: NAD(P)/FAD-dependent oxidoreductase [Sandaracinaceae bacterium]|nr:NAD(P)/FAD-dependent oxidoreductase [Sandaracinaceae bacterium]
MTKYDVAILGGGLAGNLLARQLRRTVPEASIALFEKDEETSWKVGESTVEIASSYLTRRLGLSTYLYDQQLPKNGLRFFFDTPDKSAELTAMSELGSNHLPRHPTFQLDRARLEADLRRFNVELGADMHVGWTVRDVEIVDGDHVVTVRGAGEEKTVRARWVVDATGRASTIARKLDLRVTAPHPLASVWARFADIVDLDDLPAPEWRARVRHTSRVLSTNHFCYPGYWIWLIPLARGVTSVGIVGEKGVFREGSRAAEGFRALLDEHRAVRDVLAPGELLDVGGYTQLAYGTKRFFGRERWALIGDAAAFSDPFYSPGSDYISIENDLVTDLIRRDLRGGASNETSESLSEVVDLYDDFMQFRFAATLLLYRGQYQCLGSFPILRLKWNFDIGCYYNLWLDSYLRDAHLDLREVRAQLRRKTWILEALSSFRDLFEHLATELKARGTYYDRNLGEYNNGTDCLHFQEEIGRPRKRREINARSAEVFDLVRRGAMELLGARELPMPDLALLGEA